jgi:hypothetical protein
MKYRTLAFAVVLGVIAVPHARAQSPESAPGPGLVDVTIIPGGGTFFTESKDAKAPAFGNYDLGASLAYNITPYVGVEAEVSGALGVSQDFDVSSARFVDERTPHLLNYSGNLVLHAPGRPLVPYVTAGIGGLTLFERATLGVDETETFLTGNVGGGLKWYAGRWGLRADYRFVAVRGKDEAPAFWGQNTRYGHRVYAGVILNVAR